MLFVFVLFVMFVEVVNMVIEVVIDWIGFEIYLLLGLVKDLGFVVVLIVLMICVLVWGGVFVNNLS